MVELKLNFGEIDPIMICMFPLSISPIQRLQTGNEEIIISKYGRLKPRASDLIVRWYDPRLH